MKTMNINNKLIVFREKRDSTHSLNIRPYGKDCGDGPEITLFDVQKNVRDVKEERKVYEGCNICFKKDRIDVAKNLTKVENDVEKIENDMSQMKDDLKNLFKLFNEQKKIEKRNEDLKYQKYRK